MDQAQNAVTSAPAETVEATTETPSASVEETTTEAAVSSEKTENAQDAEVVEGSSEEQMIPKSRLDEVIAKRNEAETRLSEAEAKAKLFDELQKNPTLAQGYLQNMPEQAANPQLAKAIETLKAQGFMTAEEVQNTVRDALQAQREEMHYRDEANRLKTEYTGDNGMPKFDVEQVIDWANTHNGGQPLYRTDGMPDLEKMFKLANEAAFADAQAKSEKPTTKSERGGQTVGESVDEKSRLIEQGKQTGDFKSFFKSISPYRGE